ADTIDSQLHLQTGDLRLDGGAGNEAGCIRYNDTTNVLEFSNDCTAGVPVWDEIGSSEDPRISDLDPADANNTIDNTAWNQVWQWTLTGAETGLLIGEAAESTGGNGDQFL